MNEFSSYRFHLEAIEWAIFGSYTWSSESRRNERAEWYRQDDFKHLFNQAARYYKIRGKDFAFYRAMEFGAGECHYHFLVAKAGINHISPIDFSTYLKDGWRHGRSHVVPYDQAEGLRGVQYCLKLERDSTGRLRDRIDYPSLGLIRLIKRGSKAAAIICS
jgi:hypothetical protein